MSTISKFAGRVVCTKAQFDALAEKDPNKEYLVTDDDTYVVAPSTGGTAGQVLKKTANGTEWANESGGGGGAKLYLHKIIAHFRTHSGDIYLSIINNSVTSLTNSSQLKTYIGNGIPAYYNGSEGTGAVGIKSYASTSDEYCVQGAIADSSSQVVNINFQEAFILIDDTVTEL